MFLSEGSVRWPSWGWNRPDCCLFSMSSSHWWHIMNDHCWHMLHWEDNMIKYTLTPDEGLKSIYYAMWTWGTDKATCSDSPFALSIIKIVNDVLHQIMIHVTITSIGQRIRGEEKISSRERFLPDAPRKLGNNFFKADWACMCLWMCFSTSCSVPEQSMLDAWATSLMSSTYFTSKFK